MSSLRFPPPHTPSHLPDPPRRGNADAPRTESPSDRPPSPFRPESALDFDPTPDQAADIIQQLVSPHESFSSIAERHQISVESLTLWATRPEIVARIDAIESVCARRVRVVSVNHLPACIEAMSRVVSQFNWDDGHILYPYDSVRHNEQKRRNRETAVRATRALLTLAHFAPGPRAPTSPPSPTPPQPRPPRNSEAPSLREGAPGNADGREPDSPQPISHAPSYHFPHLTPTASLHAATHPPSDIPHPKSIRPSQIRLAARLLRVDSPYHTPKNAAEIARLRTTLTPPPPLACINSRNPPSRNPPPSRFAHAAAIQERLRNIASGNIPAHPGLPTPAEINALRAALTPPPPRAEFSHAPLFADTG